MAPEKVGGGGGSGGAAQGTRWRSPAWLLEAFVAANLAFLVVDIALAHSVNEFAHPAEWVPLAFSALAAVALLPGVAGGAPRKRAAAVLGEAAGWGAVLVGVGGLLFHLEGEFFERMTLDSLVYSAPFVAPLAYTGLGLLLLLNRRADPGRGPAWGQWVLFLATAGVLGNFGLSLADHAQNGFFRAAEWIPVAAAALGVGALLPVLVDPGAEAKRRVAWWGLGLQVLTGILGFGFHVIPAFTRTSSVPLFDRVVYGAPLFAPLLFADLAVLAALGLWAAGRVASTGQTGPGPAGGPAAVASPAESP